MKTSILILSLVFSSATFAAGKSYDSKPNCSARTATGAFDKDKQKVAKSITAEFFKTYTPSKKSPNATI